MWVKKVNFIISKSVIAHSSTLPTQYLNVMSGRYVDALNELDVKRCNDDATVSGLLKQFERYSHTDLTDEIKSLKVRNLYCIYVI